MDSAFFFLICVNVWWMQFVYSEHHNRSKDISSAIVDWLKSEFNRNEVENRYSVLCSAIDMCN